MRCRHPEERNNKGLPREIPRYARDDSCHCRPEKRSDKSPPREASHFVRDDTKGFTLLEVLIVIVIISIIMMVATLSIHFNKKKQLETFTQQIANLITLAEEEAMLRPAVLGIALTSKTILVTRYDEKTKTWQPLTGNAFRKQTIPGDNEFTLSIQNQKITLDGNPHLLITSSGDIPAFQLNIGGTEEEPEYQIIGESSGNVYAK